MLNKLSKKKYYKINCILAYNRTGFPLLIKFCHKFLRKRNLISKLKSFKKCNRLSKVIKTSELLQMSKP